MYRCTTCSTPSLVKQTRVEGIFVRRRYHCVKCKQRFSTVEYAVADNTRTSAGELPKPYRTEAPDGIS